MDPHPVFMFIFHASTDGALTFKTSVATSEMSKAYSLKPCFGRSNMFLNMSTSTEIKATIDEDKIKYSIMDNSNPDRSVIRSGASFGSSCHPDNCYLIFS